MAEEFGQYKVVAFDQRGSNPNSFPIIQISADQSDNEICFGRSDSNDNAREPLNLEAFYLSLKSELERYPDYSLVVSERFQIDDEHTGRADVPVQDVEVDEEAEAFRLPY